MDRALLDVDAGCAEWAHLESYAGMATDARNARTSRAMPA